MMNQYVNSTFKNQEVVLDSKHFSKCLFENCLMIYGASGPVTMTECSFINTQWALVGAAQITIRFLGALYHGGQGGEELIEQLFETIRQGQTVGPEVSSIRAGVPTQEAVQA